MDEMIERVAEALARASDRWPSQAGAAYVPAYWEDFVIDARAAIEAMREPIIDLLNVAAEVPGEEFDAWLKEVEEVFGGALKEPA